MKHRIPLEFLFYDRNWTQIFIIYIIVRTIMLYTKLVENWVSRVIIRTHQLGSWARTRDWRSPGPVLIYMVKNLKIIDSYIITQNNIVYFLPNKAKGNNVFSYANKVTGDSQYFFIRTTVLILQVQSFAIFITIIIILTNDKITLFRNKDRSDDFINSKTPPSCQSTIKVT